MIINFPNNIANYFAYLQSLPNKQAKKFCKVFMEKHEVKLKYLNTKLLRKEKWNKLRFNMKLMFKIKKGKMKLK